ncbi:TonB-dependent receptor [Aliarcobacter lanthieri]|uniref:TonB-dependent receptor n=1 Tax=Aliarcobacter lanthieri TaxID=1355374 RepID=UPI00047DB2E1|nr:TonB-dependent receptor [Aliarcobacter lanthieri]QKF59679.1 TonB-dependent siderophore receptor [Aliarcobacter lanthieri]
MNIKLSASVVIIVFGSILSANQTTILDEIKVSEEIENSFGYLNQFKQENYSGSKLGLTIKETPASVEVINSKTMEYRGDTTVLQVVTKTTGMTAGESGHGTGGKYGIRGFVATPGVTFLNDGIKLNGSAFSKRSLETANLDKIEIIRGASSVLNGEGSIGATVNLITKKPNFTKEETEFGFKGGSYDSYRFNFGTGGVAIEDKLAYRFDVSTREIGSNFDGEKREIDSLSAGLLYKINDNLLTSISFEKTKDNSENIYIGTPLVNGKLDKSIRKVNYNPYTDGIDKGDNLFIRQGLEWYPTQSIEVKNTLYYQDIDSKDRRPYRVTQIGNTNQVYIAGTDIVQKQDLIGNRLDFIYKEDIFGFENKLLLGVDISKFNFKRDISSAWGGYNTDMYNPNKGTFGDLGGSYATKDVDVDVNQVAVYLENQLNITDDLKFVAGLRHDTLDINWKYFQIPNDKSRKYNELSYRAGLVYDITDTTTLYASYSSSLENGSTSLVELSAAQTDLDLTEASQYEIGLRQSFLDDKAEFTASAYKINKKNIFVPDTNNPGKVLNAGKQSSKGLEFSLGIQPIEQIQIDANLSYVDSIFDEFYTAVESFNGKTPNSVSKYVANFGLRYMPISDLGIGTWIRYVDSFYADNSNTIKLPSYTTIDLTLDYTYNKNTTFSFLLKNLTDEFYATSAKNRADVFLGDARSFEFGINYKF